jgi:NAD(P)-dependent dehydrogenase (short-subunit alcohol dehydrogenase family)
VDVLYVNVGIANSFTPISALGEDDLDRHLRTNLFGAIFTFQAVFPLPHNGSDKEVAFITSLSGSLLGFAPSITGSYGIFRAVLNHVVRQIDLELKDWV